jgi:hypothetical protein
LILLARFEVLFDRQEPGFWAALGGSQSGSQRAQPSGDAERRPATITPGGWHAGRHRATSGDWAGLIWEQEAAGSNPAIPTIFRICWLLVGAKSGSQLLSPMSASVAQRLPTLAPISPADRSIILLVELVFDCLRMACPYEVARSRRSFGRRQVIRMNCARRRDPATSDGQMVPRRSPAEAPGAGHPEPVWSPASADGSESARSHAYAPQRIPIRTPSERVPPVRRFGRAEA